MKAYYFNTFYTGSEKQIVLINDNQIESKKLCETYDDFGQQCGCYAAGCYSIDNCESDFESDLKDVIKKKFGQLNTFNIIPCFDEYAFEYEDEPEEDDNTDVEEINKFINEWIKENTSHCDAEVFEYHDGSNWHSLAISVEGTDPALEEIEEGLNAEIVNEYISGHRTEFVQGKMVFETEHFIFTVTQFASDWTIANVDKK